MQDGSRGERRALGESTRVGDHSRGDRESRGSSPSLRGQYRDGALGQCLCAHDRRITTAVTAATAAAAAVTPPRLGSSVVYSMPLAFTPVFFFFLAVSLVEPNAQQVKKRYGGQTETGEGVPSMP